MFKSLAIAPMVQEDSEELIQLINPEQESDLKPEDLTGGVIDPTH
jgi:ATP-dependent Lon protease